MPRTPSRRDFVRSTAMTGAVLGLHCVLPGLRPLSAREMGDLTGAVRFDRSIEPLVRLLEQTGRAELLEVFANKVNAGTTYKEVLTALLLAGIRNIPPRPDVGWKFHAVLVVHSVNLACHESAEEDRWLPVFWALDFFKSQQMYDARESDWSLPAVDEAAVPKKAQVRAAFAEAMDGWQDDAADAATAGLVRGASPAQVFEQMAYYGMRDFRNIGHKPIFMAGAFRTLETIGWQHAEPVMRSLVYAFLNHHDEPNPAEADLEADAPWWNNVDLVDEIRADAGDGSPDANATLELMEILRVGTWREASEKVVAQRNGGISTGSILDALYCGSAELLIRQPGIVALHSVTATNALMHAWRQARNPRTRNLLLLQNAAFLVQFRESLRDNGGVSDDRIDAMRAAPADVAGEEALAEIFQLVGAEKAAAADRLLGFLEPGGGRATEFMDAARRMVFAKSRNGHDYKFTSAVLEDYQRISPRWRDRYLAASAYYLPGTMTRDNRVALRARSLLGG